MTEKKNSASKAGHSNKDHPQSSPYDKIWRENMESALPGIIKKVLGIATIAWSF